MEIRLITSAFLLFKLSHENNDPSGFCCLLRKSTILFFFFWMFQVSSVFIQRKSGDNYGNKRTCYQSRLTTSLWAELLTPFYLLKRSRREDELHNSHLRDSADFPPNVCLPLRVWGACQSSAIWCVLLKHATGVRWMGLLFAALAAVLASLGDRV